MATTIEESTADGGSSSEKRSTINVREFLHSWDADVTNISLLASESKENQYIAGEMGISADLAEELSAVCGIDTLMCGEEPADKADLLKMKRLPKNIDLTCVKYQERELDRRRVVDYKLFIMSKMKYRVMDVQRVPDPDSTDVSPEDKIPLPNVILVVKVSRMRVGTLQPKGETFKVLGTQKLTDLRDHISCVKDDAIAGDFSSYPTVPNESLTPAKQLYKSGLFFIENVFYNDMRESDNKDYSQPILKWAEEKKHENYADFRTARMEDTTFLDLNIQLGTPYLYQHQGNCEHIITFIDVRMIHSDDPQSIHMYPFLLNETVTRRVICRSCLIDSAKWVVYDSQLTPESPCFMCHSCFTLLHYDDRGEKICPFKAYKYRQKLPLS